MKSILVQPVRRSSGRIIRPKGTKGTQFCLVATGAVANKSSLAVLLRDAGSVLSDECIGALVKELDIISSERKNKSLWQCYEAWLALNQRQKGYIVANARVFHAAPKLGDISQEIQARIIRRTAVVGAERASGIRLALVAWLEDIVDRRIGIHGCKIDYEEFSRALQDARDRFSVGKLRSTEFNTVVPELNEERQKNPTYLQQLKLLGASDIELQIAVEAFYLASADLDGWRQRNLTSDISLRHFESSLRREWKRYRAKSLRNAPANSAQELECGWTILDACMDFNGTIDGLPLDQHVVQGTYHKLADGVSPNVGWHPQFENLLRHGIK